MYALKGGVKFFLLFCLSLRKITAYFFLLLFSMQILPIKEIGKILYNNQIVEEEVPTTKTAKNGMEGDGHKFLYISHPQYPSRLIHFNYKSALAIAEAENAPQEPVRDILVPPPNLA